MRHALLIDDDTRNLVTLNEFLAVEGYETIQITDSMNLLEKLQNREDIAIILLNLDMLGREGYDIIQRLQQTNNYRHVPLVAYTKYSNKVKTGQLLDFHSFIAKPINSEQFLAYLGKILAGKRVWSF